MIDTLLTFIQEQVNQYLADKASLGINTILLTNIMNESGKYAFDENNIALTLINVEEDRIFKSQVQEVKMVEGQNIYTEPDIKVNLYIMFAARYATYSESLKQLSNIMLFFQSKSSFNSAEYPGLLKIEKFTAELFSLSFEQLNQVWAYLGAKYLPSVVYKLRLVIMQDIPVEKVMPPVTKITGKFNNE